MFWGFFLVINVFDFIFFIFLSYIRCRIIDFQEIWVDGLWSYSFIYIKKIVLQYIKCCNKYIIFCMDEIVVLGLVILNFLWSYSFVFSFIGKVS